jgi:putative membrane protein
MKNQPIARRAGRWTLLLLLAAAAAVQAADLSKGDKQILTDLAQANVNEISAGKLAQDKAQNADVKAFAQQMVDDHSKGLQAVQQVAQSKSVSLPTEPDSKHQAMQAKLAKLTGEAFDRAYLAQAGVGDHQAAHKKLLQAQKKAQDPDVKGLAAQLQPTVDQHLSKVQQLASAKGADGNPSHGNTDNPLNPANPATHPANGSTTPPEKK